MTCAALGANPQIAEILWCAVQMGAGSWAIAAILLFVLFLYGMYALRIPFKAQVPIGLLLLFVFAGGGITSAVAGGVGAFTTMMWIAVMFVGVMAALLFWRLRK